jgi:hypothetical protein
LRFPLVLHCHLVLTAVSVFLPCVLCLQDCKSNVTMDISSARCYICGQRGHLNCASAVVASASSGGGMGALTHVSCANCGQQGHSIVQCAEDRMEMHISVDQWGNVLNADGSTTGKAGPNRGGNGTPRKDWRAEAECFYCGQKGHMKFDCPKKKTDSEKFGVGGSARRHSYTLTSGGFGGGGYGGGGYRPSTPGGGGGSSSSSSRHHSSTPFSRESGRERERSRNNYSSSSSYRDSSSHRDSSSSSHRDRDRDRSRDYDRHRSSSGRDRDGDRHGRSHARDTGSHSRESKSVPPPKRRH